MAIRTECIINLKEIDFIMATCSKCKSEIRVEAGKQHLKNVQYANKDIHHLNNLHSNKYQMPYMN